MAQLLTCQWAKCFMVVVKLPQPNPEQRWLEHAEEGLVMLPSAASHRDWQYVGMALQWGHHTTPAQPGHHLHPPNPGV